MRWKWFQVLFFFALGVVVVLNGIILPIDDTLDISLKNKIFIIVLLSLVFFSEYFYLSHCFKGSIHSVKSLEAFDWTRLHELSERYVSFVKEQYSVDLKSMHYEEQVVYVATHYYFLNHKKRNYFPKYKGVEQIAAMSFLGEKMVERFHGEWTFLDTQKIPCIAIPQNNGNSELYVDLFHILIESNIFFHHQNAMVFACLCYHVNETNMTFFDGLNTKDIFDACKKYGLDLFLNRGYPPSPVRENINTGTDSKMSNNSGR